MKKQTTLPINGDAAHQGGDHGHCQGCHVNHSRKSDWAGITLADAFRMNLPYYVRSPALRCYYRYVHKAQARVAKLAGKHDGKIYTPMSKPQLSAMYTSYPLNLAVPASIGQSAFLEYQALVDSQALKSHLNKYLKDPTRFDWVKLTDPILCSKMAQTITDLVRTRLLLEEMRRDEGLGSIENYRLYCASQLRLDFVSLPDILRAVILYGDVLPNPDDLVLHPLTRRILSELFQVSEPIQGELSRKHGSDLLDMGAFWVRRLYRAITKYFVPYPPPFGVLKKASGSKPETRNADGNVPLMPGRPSSPPGQNDKIGPFDGPNPPALFDPEPQAPQLPKQAQGKENESDPRSEALNEFSEAIEAAGGQANTWEDMRSDRLERILGVAPFQEGPLQGQQIAGHEIQVDLGDKHAASGEVFDRPLGLSNDLLEQDRLMRDAAPIIAELKRNLYPNLLEVPRIERLRTSGALDPQSLPLAEFASAVYRRYRVLRQPEPKGRPLVVLVADGSGSMNLARMKMLKTLSASWFEATLGSQITVMAGLYHDGLIRRGLSGPLVEWIYHPQKTPAFSRREAIRSILSLPLKGSGGQSDALSVAFILEEAERLVPNNMVYLVLMTDCGFCSSFGGERTPIQEMRDLFSKGLKRFDDRLHTTLVALGVESGKSGLEGFVEDIINVPDRELDNPAKVAERIGVHVAGNIKAHARNRARN